jgi:hypothetical protein
MPNIPVGGAYSFLDVHATIVGPGGVITIGASAGPTDEGIEVEFSNDQNTMFTGADGTVMNALHAARSGIMRINLLKTSPANSLLSKLFNFQWGSSINWGRNVITVTDVVRGDTFSCKGVAFARHAPGRWSKEGPPGNIWPFHCGIIDPYFGVGVPDVNV